MCVGAGGIWTSQSWFVGKTSSLETFLVTFPRERERAGKDGRQKS